MGNDQGAIVIIFDKKGMEIDFRNFLYLVFLLGVQDLSFINF